MITLKKISKTLSEMISVIFTPVCVSCAKPLVHGEDTFCLDCYYSMPKTDFNIIKINPVSERFFGIYNINAATAMFHYKKHASIQKAIFALKYKNNKKVGLILGSELGKTIVKSTLFTQIDTIIPVPLHKNKLKKRGYNQSQIIAEGINSILKCGITNEVLIKTNNNPSQTHLKTTTERWENTKNIFKIQNKQTLEGKHILLVDDTITSGATISACLDVLENIENIKISIAALAWAGK